MKVSHVYLCVGGGRSETTEEIKKPWPTDDSRGNSEPFGVLRWGRGGLQGGRRSWVG